MTTPTEAVEILNRVHAADSTVLPALIAYRVPCNRALADDPTVQVGAPEGQPEGPYEVGLLGIVNGLFGVNPDGKLGYGYIAAHYDDAGVLTHFAELT